MTHPNHLTHLLGIQPDRIERPTDIPEVADAVARAAGAGEAVIPWGGGMGQDYGYPPRRADVLLDLSGLDRIVAHEAGDLTATVQAGVTLRRLQAALGESGQWLPLDPPQAERATIGGILATNAYGPMRVGYGTARDWLIGLTVVDAAGRLIHGGGKVVKNVTGYDTPKLHIGALGTLGVIVEATFKVAPLPEAAEALLIDLRSADDDAIGGLITALTARRVWPALALLHEAVTGQRYLFLEWRGPREVVAAEWAAVAALARDAGTPAPQRLDPSDFQVAEPDDAGATTHLRLTPLPADVWRTHRAVAAMTLGAASQIRTCPYTGVVDAICEDPEAAKALLARDSYADIPAAVLHAPLSLRRPEDAALWSPLPSSLPMMRAVKEKLDPNGTLNPGRFVGRI